MHEKIEMKTHKLGVAVSAGWPMGLALLVLTVMALVLYPLSSSWQVLLIVWGVIGLIFLWSFRMYIGTYLFIPPTEYKGARIIAKLGRNDDLEISGVLASEIIIKQGWLEKLFGVCHIRQKGTLIYLRGVTDMPRIQAWVEANFPRERKQTNKKGKKRRQ